MDHFSRLFLPNVNYIFHGLVKGDELIVISEEQFEINQTYRLQENGTNLIIKKFDSLNELATDWNLIMNCTGLGARSLCNDKRLVSMRGQVLKVCFLQFKIKSGLKRYI